MILMLFAVPHACNVLITKLRSANTVETQQYRKATKALLVLIPLLGITYILMIQGPTEGESANIFAYVRAVMISTQGFTVALFYCFLNTEVQNTVRHHLDRWKTERSIGGSRRYNYSSKDWSPRSRTESIRCYFTNMISDAAISVLKIRTISPALLTAFPRQLDSRWRELEKCNLLRWPHGLGRYSRSRLDCR
uniref:G-protein coupled receptors family 2 profile 2 domain-containing protein n=1 Tax=Timema monikensis TaxID=170555 RepID=A0A7R9E1B8_9NEOP|nr:unnamed protein product [Timema monikensis]